MYFFTFSRLLYLSRARSKVSPCQQCEKTHVTFLAKALKSLQFSLLLRQLRGPHVEMLEHPLIAGPAQSCLVAHDGLMTGTVQKSALASVHNPQRLSGFLLRFNCRDISVGITDRYEQLNKTNHRSCDTQRIETEKPLVVSGQRNMEGVWCD